MSRDLRHRVAAAIATVALLGCDCGQVASVDDATAGHDDVLASALSSVCDDGNVCTIDALQDGACVHINQTQDDPCDDGDPCTYADNCFEGRCKGYNVDCADGHPCTWDRCIEGACTHEHNHRWNCTPSVRVDAPSRAARLQGNEASVLVKGQVLPADAALAVVRVAGQVVTPAADGSFEVAVPLDHGANLLTIETEDVLGGKRRDVRGVRWSPVWMGADAVVAAGAYWPATGVVPGDWVAANAAGLAAQVVTIQPLAPAPDGSASSRRPQVEPAQVALHLLAAADVRQGIAPVALALRPEALPNVTLPAALAAEATATMALPAAQGCAAPPSPGVMSQSPEAWLGVDGWNALLAAAWRAGAVRGDLSAFVLDACKGWDVPGCAVTVYGESPWLLDACEAAGEATAPRLSLSDLRIDVRLGNDLYALRLYAAIEGTAAFVLAGDAVELRLGPDAKTMVDVTWVAPGPLTGHAFFFEAVEPMVRAKALPLLVQRAQGQALARWPVGELGIGVVGAWVGGVWLGSK